LHQHAFSREHVPNSSSSTPKPMTRGLVRDSVSVPDNSLTNELWNSGRPSPAWTVHEGCAPYPRISVCTSCNIHNQSETSHVIIPLSEKQLMASSIHSEPTVAMAAGATWLSAALIELPGTSACLRTVHNSWASCDLCRWSILDGNSRFRWPLARVTQDECCFSPSLHPLHRNGFYLLQHYRRPAL
jgi:hypothetical protein